MVIVSVIIPIYNSQQFLRTCLESVLSQTLKEIELICVNDGSTDDSVSIIRSYANSDKRIILVDKPNTGYGHSMNIGISIAKGKYIGIVESDDFIDLDAFNSLYLEGEKGDYDIIGSDYYSEYSLLSHTQINRRKCVSQLIANKSDKVLNKVPIWCSLYKSAFLSNSNIRFLETPGASYQDLPFIVETWLAAKSVSYVSKPFIHYRVDNPNSSMNSKDKAFCIFDCFDEIYSHFSRRNEMNDELRRILFKLEYSEYKANYFRVSNLHKESMLDEISKRLNSKINLSDKYEFFDADEIDECRIILDNPQIFLKKTFDDEAFYNEKYFASSRIIIYGSGVNGLREYLKIIRYGYSEKVFCFAESQTPTLEMKYGKPLRNVADCMVDNHATLVILAVKPMSESYFSMINYAKSLNVCNLMDVNGTIIK